MADGNPEKAAAPEAKVEETKISETKSKETVKTSKFQTYKHRFKAFAKTRKGKIVITTSVVVSIILILGLGLVVFALSRNKSDVKIAEDITANKIYDYYDYVYNTDHQLIASSVDGTRRLEILSAEEVIIDFIISPDRSKIAYSLSDDNYKDRIKFKHGDISGLNFNPIAFSAYELNLETGENKLIWEQAEDIILEIDWPIYKEKIIVNPDRVISYPNEWGPYSYPVSYITSEEDPSQGYISEELPYALQMELNNKSTRLLSYDSESQQIMMGSEHNIIITDPSLSINQILPTGEDYGTNCWITSGIWVNQSISIDFRCFEGGFSRLYSLSNGSLERLSTINQVGIQERSYLLKDDYSLNFVDSAYSSDNPDFIDNLQRLDLDTGDYITIKDMQDGESAVKVISSQNVVALIVHNNTFQPRYTYYLVNYNNEVKTLEPIGEVTLEKWLAELSFNITDRTASYYRESTVNSETIMEYIMVNIDTLVETQLATLPKKLNPFPYSNNNFELIWLNLE